MPTLHITSPHNVYLEVSIRSLAFYGLVDTTSGRSRQLGTRIFLAPSDAINYAIAITMREGESATLHCNVKNRHTTNNTNDHTMIDHLPAYSPEHIHQAFNL